MPRQHTRHTIAPGIVRDGNRIVATVTIGSSRNGSRKIERKIFPLGTDVAVMRAWQHGATRDLLLATPASVRGSLAADIATFLATMPESPYKRDSVGIFKHWSASPVGVMARDQITALDLRGQIKTWADAGVAASTINRRLSRLRALYTALDNEDAPTPLDKIKFLPEPKGEPRDIPIRIVKLILDSIPNLGRPERFKKRATTSQTKLRLSVMAYTGIPPASIARVTARDIDFRGKRIFVGARRKGKGVESAWVALLPPAVDALRAFVAAGLVGKPWSNSSAGKSWRVGIARATKRADELAAAGDESWANDIAALPPRCKPYDLRHSFGTEVYAATGDIRAVAELLRHSNLETTKRYTKGAVSARVATAIATAATVYASATPPPASPPAAAPLRLVRHRQPA